MKNSNSALVLFSGGQDSATCLAWALEHFEYVETVGFNYGQRHKVELDCRSNFIDGIKKYFPEWGMRLGDQHTLEVSSLGALSETALTRETQIAFEESGLPNTFVPGRNLIFFNFAAAIAYRRGLRHLVGGMCETDFSGYPDCRDDTLKALQVTLNLGMNKNFVIHTPLMWLDKAATWTLAQNLGSDALLGLVEEHTHSCYLGDRSNRYEWGFGCGQCPACNLRRSGWSEFRTAHKKKN
jgi:7-cyano-7-deazaguanine synthase